MQYFRFIDRIEKYEMLFEDVVVGGPSTNQHLPGFGE